MTESVVFSAPWDQKLAVLTAVFSLIPLGLSAALVWLLLATEMPAPARVLMSLSAVAAVSAVIAALLLAPRGYVVEGGRLRIDRWISPIEIPLASIQSAERLKGEALAGSLRTLGSGGLFGYYGRFRNKTLGKYRMYATRSDGYVVVQVDCPYVLTPDSPDRFLEALRQARAGASAPGGRS
jgi:hypothetical protein